MIGRKSTVKRRLLARFLGTWMANLIGGVFLVTVLGFGAFFLAFSIAHIGAVAGGHEPPTLPEWIPDFLS